MNYIYISRYKKQRFVINNTKQNDKDELIDKENVINTKSNNENISANSIKSRKVNNKLYEKVEYHDNISSIESK